MVLFTYCLNCVSNLHLLLLNLLLLVRFDVDPWPRAPRLWPWLGLWYQIGTMVLFGSQVLVNITALDPFRGSGIPSILSERLKTQTLCVAHILTTTSQHVLAI